MKTAKYTLLFLLLWAAIGLVQAQEKKMLKLPNGDEVVDISGEWDTLMEFYGSMSQWGNYENVSKITLNGDSFVGVRMKSTSWYPEGSEAFRGNIDKDGIKNFKLKAGGGTYNLKGQINEDGDKIIMDDGSSLKFTLTRKK